MNSTQWHCFSVQEHFKWFESQSNKDMSPSYAIIKFDPSLGTAYCYRRHMLLVVVGRGVGGGA